MWLIKAELPPKIFGKLMFRRMGPLQSELRLEIRSDEALTLEKSALLIFHGGNSIRFLNQ